MAQYNDEMHAIIDDFALFADWEDKFSYLIDLGKGLAPLDEHYKTPANKVKGCMSQVWLICEKKGDNYYFQADSDAHLVKGLIAILLRVYSGQNSPTIQKLPIKEFFQELGLTQQLSPNRSNGLAAMISYIKTHSSS